ncbi:MAG: hypothetical protein ACI9MC_004163, partial [Kiritimatiellia bacterium]
RRPAERECAHVGFLVGEPLEVVRGVPPTPSLQLE